VNHASVTSLEPHGDTIRVGLRIGDERLADETIEARCMIKCGGTLRRRSRGAARNHSWKIYPVRGDIAKCGGPRASLINISCIRCRMRMTQPGVHFTRLCGERFCWGRPRLIGQSKTIRKRSLPISDLRQCRNLLPEIEEKICSSAIPDSAEARSTGWHGIARFCNHPRRQRAAGDHLVGIGIARPHCAPAIAEHVAQLAAEV